MNNTDIDALSGRELDAAVAVEFDWRWMQPRMAEGITLYTEDEIADHDLIEPRTAERLEGWDEGVPFYSADIALAWELDGEGWEWSSDDAVLHEADGKTMEVSVYIGTKSYNGLVKWSAISEKAAAYATARCRAWLKAKYTEKGEQC